MAVIKGIIREVGRSKTTRISARKWYGSTTIIVQEDKTGQTYQVTLSANIMDKYRFLPRVGMPVIIHGFVEDADYGLCDFVVSRVTKIMRNLPDHGAKKIISFDDEN
jgi:hypothetical protein